MKKPFKEAQVKELVNQVYNEKITFSRFVEILNENATGQSLLITNDPQEYLQEWEKKNNPFYPEEMRWDRLKVNLFLKYYKTQCSKNKPTS